jgi:hypothetical protein
MYKVTMAFSMVFNYTVLKADTGLSIYAYYTLECFSKSSDVSPLFFGQAAKRKISQLGVKQKEPLF